MSIGEETKDPEKDSSFKLANFDVSIRALLAVMLTLTVCVMHLWGLEVKEPLYTLSTMAIGLYFGQKNKNS